MSPAFQIAHLTGLARRCDSTSPGWALLSSGVLVQRTEALSKIVETKKTSEGACKPGSRRGEQMVCSDVGLAGAPSRRARPAHKGAGNRSSGRSRSAAGSRHPRALSEPQLRGGSRGGLDTISRRCH